VSRALKAVLLSAVVSGIVSFLVAVGPGPSKDPATPSWLSTGRAASAESLGIPLRYRVVERSEARYRVREQLVGFTVPNDAVGTTTAIQGGIAFDSRGRVLPSESRFTVDLRTLRSDEARRDNYLRRNTLETDRYPTADFVPTEVRGLGAPFPQTGTVSFELVGDLTIRDATRRLTWEATATIDGQELSIRARTAFRFADFGLRVPRVSVVLSVEDNIQLETDLLLRQSP